MRRSQRGHHWEKWFRGPLFAASLSPAREGTFCAMLILHACPSPSMPQRCVVRTDEVSQCAHAPADRAGTSLAAAMLVLLRAGAPHPLSSPALRHLFKASAALYRDDLAEPVVAPSVPELLARWSFFHQGRRAPATVSRAYLMLETSRRCVTHTAETL